ncbi:conserved hypothetical protein [Bdellovibrio bacteriovorus HD100]|uniref:Uncharacterized protein n=1 Tax=Bdellovibrio bacteriovorus (strain ATCC 15356 / DSM 50701 / NCIMB 9529 / HD100) TaxID=264462 RepID=Q6MNM9_BDEBA|nr:conserved hypothetical protein [Bdellovibrio bacteriovorus HD100]
MRSGQNRIPAADHRRILIQRKAHIQNLPLITHDGYAAFIIGGDFINHHFRSPRNGLQNSFINIKDELVSGDVLDDQLVFFRHPLMADHSLLSWEQEKVTGSELPIGTISVKDHEHAIFGQHIVAIDHVLVGIRGRNRQHADARLLKPDALKLHAPLGFGQGLAAIRCRGCLCQPDKKKRGDEQNALHGNLLGVTFRLQIPSKRSTSPRPEPVSSIKCEQIHPPVPAKSLTENPGTGPMNCHLRRIL